MRCRKRLELNHLLGAGETRHHHARHLSKGAFRILMTRQKITHVGGTKKERKLEKTKKKPTWKSVLRKGKRKKKKTK